MHLRIGFLTHVRFFRAITKTRLTAVFTQFEAERHNAKKRRSQNQTFPPKSLFCSRRFCTTIQRRREFILVVLILSYATIVSVVQGFRRLGIQWFRDCLSARAQGLRVYGYSFCSLCFIQVSGPRIQGLRFMGLGFKFPGLRFRVSGVEVNKNNIVSSICYFLCAVRSILSTRARTSVPRNVYRLKRISCC